MVDLLARPPGTHRAALRLAALTLPALAATALLAGSAHAASPVPLGTADSFAILAGSTITNVGPSTISGDIGLCCSGIATTGFGSLTQPRGTLYTGTGGVAASAQADLDIAYANAASQAVTQTVSTDLSLSGTPATPLQPGVYESTAHGAFEINTGLTLDFQGNPNSVFIFQGTKVTTAAAAAGSINIVNGGAAPSTCNIYWQLADATQGVTLGAASAFKGTTMSLGASALGTAATVEGRILTRRSKQVSLLANTITQTPCATATALGGGPAGSTPPSTPLPTGTAPSTVPSASTAPSTAPSGTSAPDDPPSLEGSAGTAQLTGPSAPVSGPFEVWVTGEGIQNVAFTVDNRWVKTVRNKAGRTKYKLKIDPRRQKRGAHRVTARVRFRSPGRRTTTLRIVYRRPPAKPHGPRFTG